MPTRKNLDPKNPTPHSPRGWYRQTYDAGDSVVAALSLAYVRDVLERDGPFQASKIAYYVWTLPDEWI